METVSGSSGTHVNWGNEYLIQRELSVTSHKPIRSLAVNILQMILFVSVMVSNLHIWKIDYLQSFAQGLCLKNKVIWSMFLLLSLDITIRQGRRYSNVYPSENNLNVVILISTSKLHLTPTFKFYGETF